MPELMNSHDLLSAKITLEEWKGNYFNTNTNFRKVAIKGFWKMYNPDTSSLWFCDSKYNAENSVTFKVGRFADQYAFGKMLVFRSKVKGLWLFNGQAIPKGLFDECYDMKLYEWTKVDISDEAQKARVNQMIEDCEDFEGETIREVYFKC
ncbi:elongation factor 1-gamma 3-like [Trifolium pratense]|uniref:elongation factor 1-gamma 3-like n=1 Tax=Trifolium pratense TaxID=57577 RepID=UPI001E69553C|nr:elongation factor 1-gamma 3-like [Trifolium pratense]